MGGPVFKSAGLFWASSKPLPGFFFWGGGGGVVIAGGGEGGLEARDPAGFFVLFMCMLTTPECEFCCVCVCVCLCVCLCVLVCACVIPGPSEMGVLKVRFLRFK